MAGDDRAPAGALTRAAAADAVDAVLSRQMRLDMALAAVTPDGIADRDRAQIQSLSFGALRWHHRNRFIIDTLLERPLRDRDRVIAALLSVGLFQLDDPEQPDYAAVSATVSAARLLGRARAAGLVNAALRRYQRERASLLAAAMQSAEARYSHPAWLIDCLVRDWPTHADAVLAANQQHPPLWIRVNRARTSVAAYAARLRSGAGIEATALAGVPGALRLASPVPASLLPGFADGDVTIQDAASQLAAPILAVQPGMRVLDACAAPGGKTGHLLECAGGELQLTAVEQSAERTGRLAETLARLRQRATLLTGDVLDPGSWWSGQPFERILLDAPCSATGVIRRHPDIKWLRRAADVVPLAARQRQMLEALWPLLAPGGRLLYATCSILRVENARVVEGFLREQPDAREVPIDLPGIAAASASGMGPGLQLLPGAADTDGFYYALMERRRG